MNQTMTTTKEQASAIRSASQNPIERRAYWQIVADVMGIDRNANFVWTSIGTSSTPNLDNQLTITIF